LQKEDQINKSLYTVVDGKVPSSVISRNNKLKKWRYGYDPEYDIVVISKDGTIGEIYLIEDLYIALPETPEVCFSRSDMPEYQYWEQKEPPKELMSIPSIFHWNEKPREFRSKWIPYINDEFDRRELGFWFMNNGKKTYMTGSHYMYCQWSSIDVGYPDFREANRILYIFWEACVADERCFGMTYLKIRRSGFSFMGSSECVNKGTISKKKRIGILSKTGTDAKKLFTDKVVPINTKYPFFFKPVMDGMDKPKSELSYRVPASKITKKSISDTSSEEIIEGLDTSIDWKNTDDNSYDGEKLFLLLHDESGKWMKPNNILENWRVTKTCLRLGKNIIGKCMMGSTCNSQKKGGKEYKQLYLDSKISTRNKNGQTKSGMYSIFIPTEWNLEGFIDKHGMPVINNPETPVIGIDGAKITMGAIEYWENEVESMKHDQDALNEFYRQFPRTESHAFRDETKDSLMNLSKIYQQIDHNDSLIIDHHITRGRFEWKDGIRDTTVVFYPDRNGRFLVSWIPPKELQNKFYVKNGIKYPANDHIGVFGCDSYDISGTVGGGGSNGSLHGLTKFNFDDAPSNKFFLEYIARPQTAEIFFEDVLMSCVFYGLPLLAENNKPRLLYHFKNRGYRGFSMNRPDKPFSKLSKTEKELGGIPSSSEDIIQSHASAIESYIEKYIGYDVDGTFRDPEEIGDMPFNRTLQDWALFDITNRTKHDASISSGLAIMACQKNLYMPEKKESKISIKFAKYRNSGNTSELIR
jgi:hypothetical protein